MLKISNVETFYGKIQALRGVDIDVNDGEIVSLIGSNGAGKSTLLMTISGVNKARNGNITLNGERIENRDPHKIVDLGICQVPEGRRIFSRLTVEENLIVASRKGFWDLNKIKQIFPRLSERLTQMSNSLSGGEQQMLAIARTLMTNPKMLILDEATEGLSPNIRSEIWTVITILKSKGVSILIIDKSLKQLQDLADKFYILEKGKTVWHGSSKNLTSKIAQRHLGV